MRVALVHDYIKEYGGAEKVLEALHELFPQSPVFTSIYLPNYLGPHRQRFANWNIRTSFLQHIPFNDKLISPFRLLSSQVFQSFDFSDFDVIITSSTGGYIPNSLNKKHAKLICYCHTPPRYLYGYATARDWRKNALVNGAAQVVNHFLRMADFDASKNVDLYIANSREVAGRIKKFYRKEAIVVYPPVDVNAKFEIQSPKLKKKEIFLAGGRLARAKHIDVIIKACLELRVPLKVFGKSFAGYGEELRQMINDHRHMLHEESSTIEFLGEVTDEEKWQLYANAKALLFASEDEDFGIMPVEAMAAGTPVIAYRSGGVQETVVDGKTGLFYDKLCVESLRHAMLKFESMKFDAAMCVKQAEKFSKEKFMKEVKDIVNKMVKV